MTKPSASDHSISSVPQVLGRKVRLVRFIQHYVLNRPVRRLVLSGRMHTMFGVIETRGRKSGLPRHTPIVDRCVGDTFWIIAEQGTGADYVQNILADPTVRVHSGGCWRVGKASVMETDDSLARLRTLPHRVDGAVTSITIRWIGTRPVTIRVDLR
jgi:deazaflavin-dependent oxidoreductase (nitroreductase family)